MSDAAAPPNHLFYDGTCALCHRSVKFALRHPGIAGAFRFAPLQGPTFERLIEPSMRASLPDSMVILTSSGQVLTRSDAALELLRHAGGAYSALSRALAIVPRPVRDAAYNAIAAVRYKIFGRTTDLCPVMTPQQRERFDP
jgi:predicted DCC family thiol-disulfide oxidoreductase YuxK